MAGLLIDKFLAAKAGLLKILRPGAKVQALQL